MKKVLSAIMVVAILLTSAVSVFASEGTRFIEQSTGGVYIKLIPVKMNFVLTILPMV